jgi:hypothetical protein
MPDRRAAGEGRRGMTSRVPWFEQVSDTPKSFCDPASVAALLEAALDAETDEEERDAAAGALSRVVKALEIDSVDESERLIVARLPELAAGLLNPNPYYNGQMISILRRFRPDAPTVDALLGLLATDRSDERANLVVALGTCDRAAWSDAVESALARALEDPVCADAAGSALYDCKQSIRMPETIPALAAAAACMSEGVHRARTLGALAGLGRSPLAGAAAAALDALVAARPDLASAIAAARALFAPRPQA